MVLSLTVQKEHLKQRPCRPPAPCTASKEGKGGQPPSFVQRAGEAHGQEPFQGSSLMLGLPLRFVSRQTTKYGEPGISTGSC